ncbi:hypothetical protein GR183_03920 [Stappia sp. GBMRC 2046]|uniref:Uncharacterized protein n=1 Tax=Stappia sediminis TaxID=2692190 RepID=A0A7X3LS14_9HYPH|nr:hypothetical protein [Stappia sediminis]MXN64042.1 hypothetical protein [Stappia sediminis]
MKRPGKAPDGDDVAERIEGSGLQTLKYAIAHQVDNAGRRRDTSIRRKLFTGEFKNSQKLR